MKSLSYKSVVLPMFIAVAFLTGCKKDNPANTDITGKTEAPATTQKVNTFIKDAMTNFYLWTSFLPNIDTKYETDSKSYFEKLLYKDDKWSYITDNIADWENSLQGIEKTFGYSLAFGQFVNASGLPTGEYFAIVEYVYPNTAATRAGIDRGSIITQINGSSITKDNYISLLNGEKIKITKGELTSSGIANTDTVSMTSEVLNLDPVILYKVIETEGHKIGYLFYNQFIASYNSSLATAFNYFKSNQITDLVLDLRYNPGGEQPAAVYLCSSIAPASAVDNIQTLMTFQWNDRMMKYWAANDAPSQTIQTFNNMVPVKLDLNKVTILTSHGTASASEFTITGLKPYMNVVLVGDTTYGKYTGSWTLKPQDLYSDPAIYADFKNWGIQPIVLRYANSQGVTNFVNGFPPDFLVSDELLPAQPLGDLSEPLLKKAVENITGVPILAAKSALLKHNFKVFDRGFSEFDHVKRNLQMDIKKDFLKGKAE